MINDAYFTFVRVLALSTIILALVMGLNRKWKIITVIVMMVVTPLVVAAITLYQLLFQGTLFSTVVVRMATALGLPVFRATGTFGNPNVLACFLMVGAVIGFALLFHKKNPLILQVLILLAVLGINSGLLGSFSRGGWLSTFAAVSIIVALHKRWSFFAYFGIFMVVCMIVISIQVPRLWEVVFERFGTIFNSEQDASSMGRIALIKSGIWMWMDYPILGVGLRSFPAYFADYIDPSMPKVLALFLQEAHTIQFEILAEFGLVGITIGSWLFFTVLFEGLRTIKTIRNDLYRCLQIGLTALYVGFMVNFTFATDIMNNLFWITVGLIYVIPLVDREETEDTVENGEVTPLKISSQ
jgi:O-antigen ligase